MISRSDLRGNKLLRRQRLQPVDEVERLPRGQLVGAGVAQQGLGLSGAKPIGPELRNGPFCSISGQAQNGAGLFFEVQQGRLQPVSGTTARRVAPSQADMWSSLTPLHGVTASAASDSIARWSQKHARVRKRLPPELRSKVEARCVIDRPANRFRSCRRLSKVGSRSANRRRLNHRSHCSTENQRPRHYGLHSISQSAPQPTFPVRKLKPRVRVVITVLTPLAPQTISARRTHWSISDCIRATAEHITKATPAAIATTTTGEEGPVSLGITKVKVDPNRSDDICPEVRSALSNVTLYNELVSSNLVTPL